MLGIKKKIEPKLGRKARDIITGYEGVIIGEYEYLHGCKRWCIQAEMKADKTIPEDRIVDDPQLEVLSTKRILVAKAAKKFVKLGDQAKDTISGFEGRVLGRATFINGCHRTGLYPKVDSKGKHLEAQWFDEPQLETVKPIKVKREIRTGGPVSSFDPGKTKNVR